MKFLLLVSASILLSSAASGNPPLVNDLTIAIAKCTRETGVTDEIAQKIFKHELVEDHTGKCFKKCLCTEIGSCVPDLKINATAVLEKVPQLPADRVFDV